MHATVRFTVVADADPLLFAFQAARLALVQREAVTAGLKIDRPVPTLLLVTGAAEPMARLIAALEGAHVFALVELEVDAADEAAVQDFAEYLRDRTDSVVILARPADPGPAS
jgi:hypothetical protein